MTTTRISLNSINMKEIKVSWDNNDKYLILHVIKKEWKNCTTGSELKGSGSSKSQITSKSYFVLLVCCKRYRWNNDVRVKLRFDVC